MGIFTSNTHSSLSGVDYSDLPALEGYDAVTGCATAMLEVQQNDMAMFNATIMEDFKEVAAVNEGYEVINESAFDILNKLKEIFKKLLQKIKGIFKAFISKLMGTFGTNAGMYEKYYKQISSTNNWKDFKVKKFRAVKGNGDGIKAIKDLSVYDTERVYVISDAKGFLYDLDITKKEDFSDSEEINEAIIKNRLKENLHNVDGDLKNMTEEFMNAIFETEDTKDDWSASDILNGCIGSVLQKNAGGRFKENLETSNNSLSRAISKIIDELGKISVKISDKAGEANRTNTDVEFDNQKLGFTSTSGSGNKNNRYNIKKDSGSFNYREKGINHAASKSSIINPNDSNLTVKIANLQKIATQEQHVITAFTSANIAATKFLISQARRVWSSAAAYSSREHKNEGYEFYTAVGESAAYDFDSYMEAIGA